MSSTTVWDLGHLGMRLPWSHLCHFPKISSVQSFSHVWLFATPWTAACQASLSLTNFQRLFKLMSIKLVMPSNYLILCHPLLLPSSFRSIKVFFNDSVFCIRWPKYWRLSFSISLSNVYSGLISFRSDSLVSLQSKGLWRVFSNTTVWTHQFFIAEPCLWSNSHICTWLLCFFFFFV